MGAAALEDRGDNLEAEIAAAAAAAAAAKGAGDGEGDADADKAADKAVADKAAADRIAADDAARDDKGRFIPKARFDEQVAKERTARETAERALEELQKQLKQVDVNADVEKMEGEIKELEKAHSKAILEGDADVAAELSSQIRLKERTIQIQQSQELSTRAKNEAREEVRMDAAIERLEATYPQLNQNDEENFDQDLTDFVLATQLSMIQNDRMSPSQALIAAAAKVMAKMAGTKAPADDAKGLAAAKAGGDRKAAQVAKNVATAKGQPASMKEVGMDSDKAGVQGDVDVSNMSQDEFNALPEATKQRLRGDML